MDTATANKRRAAVRAGAQILGTPREEMGEKSREETKRFISGRRLITQFGPDALPIVRTKVATGYNPVSCLLNRGAMVGRNTLALDPIPDMGLAYANGISEGGLASANSHGSLKCFYGGGHG
jgi:hypothetical protein